MEKEADSVEKAVKKFIQDGYRTKDIMQENKKIVKCSEAGDIICSFI